MGSAAGPGPVPEAFARALDSLRSVRLRPEIDVQEAPAPQRLAPHAVALSADVLGEVSVGGQAGDPQVNELGTGRFILLHDPAGHETWQGTFRVVTFVRAALEPELAADPMLAEVGWSWLLDALADRGAVHTAVSGTVTRVVSEPFGTMADHDPTAELEIRASWTPVDAQMAAHLLAWGELLATVCGLPPITTDPAVTVLPAAAGRTGPRRSR